MALLLTCLQALSIEAAKAEGMLSIENAQNYDFGTWANAGSLSSVQSGCAVAYETKGGSGQRNYSVLVENLLAGGGFYIYLDGDSSAVGSSRIEFGIEHSDSLSGSPYETLIEGEWESQKQKGQPPGCPNGVNSHLRVNVQSAELAGKLGGDYVGYFQLSIKEGNNIVSAPGSFAVSLTVGGVPQVQITHLDSIDFGQHSGLGDLSANESFCIYSSATNGAYRLSISSTGQDSNGHYLTESSGSERIPLTILYADSGSGPGTVPMTNNYVYGNGNSAAVDCAGNDNTTLTLRLAEADLQAASTGAYSERLTLLVEPE